LATWRAQALEGKSERTWGHLPILWTASRSARCPSQDSTVCHLPAPSLNRPLHSVR